MNGRAEVDRLKKRLDATFDRISQVSQDLELQSDFARFLCVLVSGFLEMAVKALIQEHTRQSGAATIQKYVEQKTRNFSNANAGKLINLLNSFDAEWGRQLECFLVDEFKDAVDSVVNLRNQIAHGGSVGVTYQSVLNYYYRIIRVVNYIADICVPK